VQQDAPAPAGEAVEQRAEQVHAVEAGTVTSPASATIHRRRRGAGDAQLAAVAPLVVLPEEPALEEAVPAPEPFDDELPADDPLSEELPAFAGVVEEEPLRLSVR